jgi:hypothetical protein
VRFGAGRGAIAKALPALLLVAGISLALTYFAIGLSCPYGIVATVMTGQVKIPGVLAWLAYKRILALAVALVLYAIYLWLRDDAGSARQANNPLVFAIGGVGVAAIGFLTVSYPCPHNVGLWLLDLDVELAGLSVPYWVALVIAAGLLLYALYGWMKTQPAG